jgi:hypothetical protein
MVQSTQSDAVLNLGKRLVAQLGVDEDIDTLSRWLAHTLAEKLIQIELAADDQKAAFESEVVDLILKLWAHRRDFRRETQPFKELEPLAQTLLLLDPANSKPRYFAPLSSDGFQHATPEAQIWLNRALAIDAAARDAIRYSLLAADALTPGDAAEWAALAEAAGLTEDIEVVLVRFRLFGESEDKPGDGLTDSQRNLLPKLEQLSEVIKTIEADIEKQRDPRFVGSRSDIQGNLK